jgi:hypothetical protein
MHFLAGMINSSSFSVLDFSLTDIIFDSPAVFIDENLRQLYQLLTH